MGRRTSRRQPNSAQRSRAQGSGLREGPRASARQANIQIRLVRWRRTPRAIWLRRARAPAARQPVPLPEARDARAAPDPPATGGARAGAHRDVRIAPHPRGGAALATRPPGELRRARELAIGALTRAWRLALA